MKRKKCVVCGELFHSKVNTARYCSEECRESGQLANRAKWKGDNPDYMKNYMRKYRRKIDPDESGNL